MELSKNYNPNQVEARWYELWNEKKYFNSKPDGREPYTVVIPPPNVTGILHMGHCLNDTIQDILVRRARMQGKNACWVPGTDHASIATEAKVVSMLREKGIEKSNLDRETFLKYAWEWKDKYGGIILQQLKKLGCSVDWERTNFTMDDHYYASVIKVFNSLYKKGYIYRGKRMINWDCKAQTALSDEEVIYREEHSHLYYIRYQIADEKGEPIPFSESAGITIATVRPETIPGDSAICVNPEDERFKHLHGKFAFVPTNGRKIPIIPDDYVTIDFGTGALKITPAHDINDYQIGQKYKLPTFNCLNADGTMNELSGYNGLDRFEARKKIVEELKQSGHLIKVEDYVNQVGFSERTNVVVEPRISEQWWVDMKKLVTPALKAVMEEEILFFPPKFKNLYRHWMENIRDWCISRQLWWGHRIPAWYDAEGNFVVAEDEIAAKKAYEEQYAKSEKLEQDSDCLDTWFSSWLWPIEVFKGISDPGNEEINYYYPTSTLVTAPEIIFFWVARMIMAGFEFKDKKPFGKVYFTGIVRDKKGRKMSKSLGNSPDLLMLIDKYGADAVRFGIMIASPAGNDLLFDESSLEQGRNFNNKLWNALKLIRMWEERIEETENEPTAAQQFAEQWFENKLRQTGYEIESLMDQFKLSEALKLIYSLIWDDFCSWYLEWVKPAQDEKVNQLILKSTISFMDRLLAILHPFMPFITEEIFHLLKTREEDLCVKQYAPQSKANMGILASGELLKKVITNIREVRQKNSIKTKEEIGISIETETPEKYLEIENILIRQLNASGVSFTQPKNTQPIIVNIEKDRFFIESSQTVDKETQKLELLKDLDHQKRFLESCNKKLGNPKFMENAKPEVVSMEKKKKSDAENRIKTIEESLSEL